MSLKSAYLLIVLRTYPVTNAFEHMIYIVAPTWSSSDQDKAKL